MPPATRSKMALTPKAYDWAQATARRKAEHADKIATLKPKTRQAIKGLAQKFELPPKTILDDGSYVVETTRVEVRLIQEMAAQELKVLKDTVLPNYEERGDQALVERTKERIQAVSDLLKAAERVVGPA